jgi:uncharacterized membrane protein YbhN (UPF0104 family)
MATASPIAPRVHPGPRERPRAGRVRVVTAGLLGVLVVSLVLALPGIGDVRDALAGTDPAWIAAAIALELASEMSFVVVFRRFFDRLEARDARSVAWSSLASSALLPAGGVGGAAVGGWLAALTGAPASWSVRSSSALFFLTTAVNAIALVTAGLLLVAGAPGPHDLLRAELPVVLAVVATAAVLAVPPLVRRRRTPAWIRGVADGIDDARRAAFRPSPRMLGAVGYLAFDIAVLWATLVAVGEHMALAALVIAYLLGYLASALPMPGGIGTLDAGLAGALVLYGAAPASAAAAVLVFHAIALWVPGLGGLCAYLRLRPRLTQAAAARPSARASYETPKLVLKGEPA